MADSNSPPPADTPPPEMPEKVSEELLSKLHQANQRFAAARHHREEAMDSPSPETVERERAQQEVRDAEKSVEDVTDEIDRDLHPAP